MGRKGVHSRSRAGHQFRPAVEVLEDRRVMSVPPAGGGLSSPSFSNPIIVFNPLGAPSPLTGALTPAQVRHAYCVDDIKFSGVVGDGRGQTIAIIDAYDDPKFVDSTNPGFATSDLHKFDVQYGLPDPPNFVKINQTGGTTLPGTDPSGGSEAETALDIEWAHAIAPRAKIIVIEANDLTLGNLITAIATGAKQPGVVTVSMSFGTGEFAGEVGNDATFVTPKGHQPVTFLAATGDNGQPGGYPAYSPNVVAVGGTALTINASNNYVGETGWTGSGGGISTMETQPSYQKGVVTQSTTMRTIPDVAFLADPATGVSVYDSYNGDSSGGPWYQIGGTSLACPCWAALITIADQGRAQYGRTSLDGRSQTLPALYNIAKNPAQYKVLFHDILKGNNGFAAGPGYDLVTGIGSPVACQLIPVLAGPPSVTPPAPGPSSPIPKIFLPFRYTFDPFALTYTGDLTLTNVGGGLLTGPATFLFPKLPPGVTLANATGYRNGVPFIKVSFSPLAANQSVRVSLVFNDPLDLPLSTFLAGFPVQLILG
jgi:subtilase family serine protease